MKELNNEALNVTSDQLSKDASLKNYMKSPDGKKTDINIVDKNKPNSATATNSTSPTTTTLEEDAMVDAQPQLKKLSLLLDASGQVSQPFEINGKQYQMVRAMDQNRKVVRGVEDMTDGNIYHEEDFDRNIATPARDMEQGPMPSIDPPFHKMREMAEHNANEAYIDYLNLNDLKGYKDFFVNPKTGQVVAKFKNARDMIKSGTKLEEDHDYMDAKQLRRLRFSNSMKNDEGLEEDVNLGKLQNDVKKLSKLIKDKFMIALEKINTPIEQSQFLVAMANEIGVPFAKLTSIINSFKDISKDQENSTDSDVIQMNTSSTTSGIAAESRVITKNQLAESIKPSNKIKIKDIRNGRL